MRTPHAMGARSITRNWRTTDRRDDDVDWDEGLKGGGEEGV